MTGNPAVVCGTAGAGTAQLLSGVMDARKQGAPVIAIAGDVETGIMDTDAFEEVNPYKLFDPAALYIGRLVDLEQARAVVGTAILTAVVGKGPTVISIPGNVAAADAPSGDYDVAIPTAPMLRPAEGDVDRIAEMIQAAKTVAIFGGDGCRNARDEVLALVEKLNAPIGYSFRAKQWYTRVTIRAIPHHGQEVRYWSWRDTELRNHSAFVAQNFAPAIELHHSPVGGRRTNEMRRSVTLRRRSWLDQGQMSRTSPYVSAFILRPWRSNGRTSTGSNHDSR